MLKGELAAHLKSFPTAPFLFVGSGMSRRYLDLEDWEGLLTKFADATGQPYARYRSGSNGELPRVASGIAKAFHEVWWESDEYAASRSAREDEATRLDSPLKIEVSNHVDDALENLDDAGPHAAELGLLRDVEVDGIITTNYDRLLEVLFPGFRSFVGQDDVLFSTTQAVGEIYKIHGSSEKPNSLVLTQDDYDSFHARNAYLAAKLLTIFVDHPVVFLGYSLRDPNIVSILETIADGLTTDHLQKLQDRLIFIEWDPEAKNPRLQSSTFSLLESAVVPVRHAKVAEYTEVYGALCEVERQLPARVLRQLKERVYRLIETTDPKGALRVVGLDGDIDDDDIEVVFGVGVHERLDKIGYLGLQRADLIEDVIENDRGLDAREVVTGPLPVILRKAKITPVYKYLREAGLLTDDGDLVDAALVGDEIADRVAKSKRLIAPSPDLYMDKAKEIAETVKDFKALTKTDEPPWHIVMYASGFDEGEVDLNALRKFLLDHKSDLYDDTNNNTHKTVWLKGVCLYDWLKYGRSGPKRRTRRRPGDAPASK